MFNNLAAVLPPKASTFADGTDWMFYFITWVSIVFFVLIVGLMVYFMIKYKRKDENDVTPDISHNLALEVTWSVIPIILVIFMFYYGYKEFARMNDPAALFEETEDGKYIDLYVTGKQWSWDVAYPNGIVVNSLASFRQETLPDAKLNEKRLFQHKIDYCKDLKDIYHGFVKDNDAAKAAEGLKGALTKYPSYEKDINKAITKLGETTEYDKQENEIFNIWARISNVTDFVTLPKGVPVRLNMTANDVIHSFAVPAFRVKKDVIKNRTAVIWFKPTMTGTFIYTCNEMCGREHSSMIGYLRVVEQGEYEEYLKAIAGPMDPWDLGKKVYESGCVSCHSIDGSKMQGPTWKDLWGKKNYQMSDGSVIEEVGKDYIYDSIINPSAKKAKGYGAAAMPSQALSPEQLEGVIQFIKSPNQKPEN